MATIDSASSAATSWNDGGCRKQHAPPPPRIGDIQRQKTIDVESGNTTPTNLYRTRTNISTIQSDTNYSSNSSMDINTKLLQSSTTQMLHNNSISFDSNSDDSEQQRLECDMTKIHLDDRNNAAASSLATSQHMQQQQQQQHNVSNSSSGSSVNDFIKIPNCSDNNNSSITTGIFDYSTSSINSLPKYYNHHYHHHHHQQHNNYQHHYNQNQQYQLHNYQQHNNNNNNNDHHPNQHHHHCRRHQEEPINTITTNTIITTSNTNINNVNIATNTATSTKKIALPPPPHIRILPKTQSLDIVDDRITDDDSIIQHVSISKSSEIPTSSSQTNIINYGMMPKVQSFDQTRPIYPNVPYSPYGSPYGSPRSGRRRGPLRESRRISIEQSGSFLQLNQYKLMDQIGQGSYGLVKLAYSEEDSIHYAMKILSKRKLLRKAGLMGRGPKRGTSPLDRVYREIAVLKKLDHPNVVKLVEVLDDPLEDSLYLVFELVQLGEVLGIPTDNPLGEERVWSIFRDSLEGLEYLHYQRIIHGDIKPGNLLLAECGRVKIADLGVCNEFLGEDASMNNGSTAGTPAFRAPETLLTGQHSYSGKAADIWALGATLYALVYGNVPFMATSVPAVYEKIKNDELKFPEQPVISDDLRDLIERMLNKDPSKRLTLPQIKEHTWVTSNNTSPLPSEEDNCRLVQISEEDINSVVKSIPKLDTLILIKTMLKKHSFQNPFSKAVSGRAPQRGGSRLERFTRAGRSNSAPGAYHMAERQSSNENILPSVTEGVVSSSCSGDSIANN